jgi:hypothetical protein
MSEKARDLVAERLKLQKDTEQRIQELLDESEKIYVDHEARQEAIAEELKLHGYRKPRKPREKKVAAAE